MIVVIKKLYMILRLKQMLELIIGSSVILSAVAIYFYLKNKHSDTKKIPFSDTLSSLKIRQESED